MKFLIVLSAVVACAFGGAVVAPYAYNGLNYGYTASPYYSAPWNYGYSAVAAPYAHSYAAPAYTSPIAHAYAAPAYAAPVAHAYAAAIPTAFKSQYHAQDELGQASYGHSEPLQTHNAVQDIHGNKVGSYSYVSPDGQVIRADYVADAGGFRVASNALPVGPTALPVGPSPVLDTPEVVAARSAHLAEFEAVKSRTKRGVFAVGHLPASTAPLAYSGIHAPFAYNAGYAPIAYNAGYSPLAYNAVHAPLAYNTIAAPLAYNAVAAPIAYNAVAAPIATPAVREATLTTIVNNPGHAVSYRVD